MKRQRPFPSGIFKVFFFLIVFSSFGVLLLFNFSRAAVNSPQRLAGVQAGNCSACHEGQSVLPGTHADTKGMSLKDCMMCHAKDKVSIRAKMPTSHVHMLSGVSCETCHGKKKPFETMDYGACVACHSTENLAKVPAKGHTMPNPHNSHYGTDVDCSLCHFQHKKSEFMCSQCHDFKNVTPSPLLPLNSQSKPTGRKTP